MRLSSKELNFHDYLVSTNQLTLQANQNLIEKDWELLMHKKKTPILLCTCDMPWYLYIFSLIIFTMFSNNELLRNFEVERFKTFVKKDYSKSDI